MKKYPNTMQHDSSDCAAAVISTVLQSYKRDLSIMKIREIIGTDAYGTSIKGIVEGLEELKFDTKAVRTELSEITKEVTLPAILHIKNETGTNHFIVLHKISKEMIFTLADPSVEGLRKVSYEELQKIYLGVAIFMVPTSEFESLNFNNKSMFDLFKSLILPNKRMLTVIIMCSLLLSVFGILSSLFSKVLMDEIIPYQLKNSLYIFLVVFALVSLIQNLLSTFRQQVLLFLSRKIDIPLLLGYYDHILHLPYFFFGTRTVGDIITRFQDAMTIKEIFTSVSISLVMDILLAAISSFFLYNINSTLFGIIVVMLLINILLLYFFKKPYKKLNYEQMEAGAALNSQLIESIQNIELIKSMGDESQQIGKLESRFVNALEIGFKEGRLANVQGFISGLVSSVGNLIFMGVGALFIIDQRMSIGDLLVFQSMSQYFSEPVQNLVSLQLSFQEAQIAMKRLSEVMSLQREDDNLNSISEIDLQGDINFSKVTFSYGSRAPVLRNLDLVIPTGMKVALVGESGSGKSTIARLLLKFIEPSNGDIYMSDYNIRDVDYRYIREKIAYIPQNIELFTGTIFENLRVGTPNATYEQVISACKKSGADEFINKLPNTYWSYIEEGGSNLSGGERQRIAIARSLLKQANIYIFDEATSNLDSFSELKIQNLIFNTIKDKTVIIIAHRLSTINLCDLIYFVENGEILERGNHEELMNLGGKYASMISIQSSNALKSNKIEKVGFENSNGDEITYG